MLDLNGQRQCMCGTFDQFDSTMRVNNIRYEIATKFQIYDNDDM